MKIVVLGKDGLLGSNLISCLKNDFDVIGFGKEVDISEFDTLEELFVGIRPNIVINTAAYNNVDLAEIDKHKAYRTNSIGPKNLGELSKKLKFRLIHYSTNFVFDGNSCRDYCEYDTVNPLNFYGYSKYCGDKFISESSTDYVIIRTSWLFGENGNNFITWYLNNYKNDEIKIVDDQVACVTYTADLTSFTRELINNEYVGIVNYANKGKCSKYELVKFVDNYLDLHGNIIPVNSNEFSNYVFRPKNGVLDLFLAEEILKHKIPKWQESVIDFLDKTFKRGEL